jgi:hypothetical protein
MGNTNPSYITNTPVPMYDLNAAQQWMNGPGNSDKLHQANDTFFNSYTNLKNEYSKYINETPSENLTNTYIGNVINGITRN